MPSGKSHAISTCLVAGVLAPTIYLIGVPIQDTLALTAGCIVGLVVTHDLDVRHRDTHSETIMRWSGGCIVGAIWNLLWLPYAYIIPRHRHPLSHWPILGTAIRLAYLLAIPALLWWIFHLAFTLPVSPSLTIAGWGIGGLALVDAVHWAMVNYQLA